MLLCDALKQILDTAPSYYLSRSTWPKGKVVYLYRPLSVALLNKQSSPAYSEDKKLILENLLSDSVDYCEYHPSVKDLLAEDWMIIEKEKLLNTI